VTALAAIAAAVVLARRRSSPPATPAESAAPGRVLRLARAAGAAVGLVGALLFGGPGHALALWFFTVATLGAAALLLLRLETPGAAAPAAGGRRELALFALAFAAALYALGAHRPDDDDSFYVNLAVAAQDAPGAPLLAADTLHGVAGLPLNLPIYRLHSYELANAAFAWLTGLPALATFHFVAAALAACFVPLAHARLLRLLAPRHWLAALVSLLVVLAWVGETRLWYGNFSFVRIWQGKSILLCVLTPLVYAYAIGFALRPTRARFALLAAAQIAALGSSSTALWAAPAASAIALASAVPLSRRGLRTFALGLLASLYVAGAGVLASGWMQRENAALHASQSGQEARAEERTRSERNQPGVQLEAALSDVLGEGRLRRVAIACVLVAWAVSPGALARRFALAAPLAVALVLLNPFASAWIDAHVLGGPFWRSLWALPIPVSMALVAIAPLTLAAAGSARRLAPAVWLLGLALFAAWAPATRGPSPENGVRLGWPSLKTPALGYRWAELLTANVPAGALVVAPRDVSVWLPTFQHSLHPLVVRDFYLAPYRARLGDEDIRVRRFMTYFAGGEVAWPDAEERFAHGLERFPVKGVCLRVGALAEPARRALRAAGFTRVVQGQDHEIWTRP
jgi:hypothetical protein